MLRGDIYFAPFGRQGKQRPVLIVSRDALNGGHSVVAVPFTSAQLQRRRNQRNCVFFAAGDSGLPQDCVAKTDEITLIDKLELDTRRGPLGRLSTEKLDEVVAAIRWVVGDPHLP